MLQEGKLLDAQKIFAFCASNFEVCDSFFWAALAEENLGEALLTLSHKQSESESAAELDFEGKEAYLRAANNYRLEAKILRKQPLPAAWLSERWRIRLGANRGLWENKVMHTGTRVK